MPKQVDPYRFTDVLTRRLIEAWIAREPQREIPWTPLGRPIEQSSLAVISTAGVALKTDRPFDQEGERRDPWWGDPSFRELPRDTRTSDVGIYHLHIDTRFGEQDLNCLLPIERLEELEAAGEIGRVAPTHYSFMGYILRPQVLLEATAPGMIRRLHEEDVDAALLIPV
jgi:D-proline reductase (dithiol) PrdB